MLTIATVGGIGLGLATISDEAASTSSTTSTTHPVTTTTPTTPDTTVSTATTSAAPTSTTIDPNSVIPVDLAQRTFVRIGTDNGVIPALLDLPEQTALLTPDLDGDGDQDIVIGGRGSENTVQWFRRNSAGWVRHTMDSSGLSIEAGGTSFDVDGDGDLDIVFGGDFSSNEIWWWQNPAPDFDPEVPWVRHTIKSGGGTQHHDMIAVDIQGDGPLELLFWNQRHDPPTLFAAQIPEDPTVPGDWDLTVLGTARSPLEGLDSGDIDLDGDVDLVAGGTVMYNRGDGEFDIEVISAEFGTGRARLGDLFGDQRLEIVWNSGEAAGPLAISSWDGAAWVTNNLLGDQLKGHSLDIGDVDGDGDLDIFAAEMRLEAGDAATQRLMLNNGDGEFTELVLASGIDNHESRLADVDGDGDLDIVGKPFNTGTPRVDVWLNETAGTVMNAWTRRVIDPDRPDRAMFIRSGDLDGDGDPDLVTGQWWYENAGDPVLPWFRSQLPVPLKQAALVADLDGDGDLDIFGTQGIGSAPNSRLAWAENDGAGNFTAHANLPNADGDFLQGAVVGQFTPGRPLQILLSWHQADQGIQALTIPTADPTSPWQHSISSRFSQDEDLSAADIDGDGDLDVMLGTAWLKNDVLAGTVVTIHQPATGMPDRNELIDMDGDGDLDVVVSYEDPVNGRVAWYEHPADLSQQWIEHPVASLTMPLSLDVGDLDRDGDIDIVVGEHSIDNPDQMGLFVFENLGDSASWTRHEVHIGDEHHDGAQLLDVDLDGDLDIVSIGWTHGRTLVYENRSVP